MAAEGGQILTDGEVTGNRADSEQIDGNDKGHGSRTYTMAVNLEGNDDKRAQRRRGQGLVSFFGPRSNALY